jgi:cation-dependent mannose-6-phosphate receptor
MEFLLGEFSAAARQSSGHDKLTTLSQDMFQILFSSCMRFLPGRRGYSRLSLNGNGSSGGRGRHSEDENRLIDELDESWDD